MIEHFNVVKSKIIECLYKDHVTDQYNNTGVWMAKTDLLYYELHFGGKTTPLLLIYWKETMYSYNITWQKQDGLKKT